MQEMSVVMMSIDECQKTLADKRARVEAWQVSVVMLLLNAAVIDDV